MNPEEYQKLARIDRDHWFYQGKRQIVRHWISRFAPLDRSDLLIDAGCGTGTLLVEMAPVCRILGLDSSAESVRICAPRVEAVGGEMMQTSLDRVPLEDGCARVVTLLDVLEHIDEDAAVLREMIRLVRPGGLLVITVPALEFLWSDWDVALHHRRRYTAAGFRQLLAQPGVEVLRRAYFNWLALGPILAVRFARRLRPAAAVADGGIGSRAEDMVPPAWVNTLLRETLVRPACVGAVHPPFGVSLLGVLRRTDAAPSSFKE